MKIDKYFFAIPDRNQGPILDKSGDFCLIGEIYDREGFNDGSIIKTSLIAKFDETFATTASGSVYELGAMHPDYEEMLNAEKAGKIIVFDWGVERKELWDDIDLMAAKLLGENITKNHVLSGEDQFGNRITGEIIAQNGNYVTLAIHHYSAAEHSEELEVFVAWKSMSFETEAEIMLSGNLAGIPREYFEKSFGFKCRPKFPCND